MSKQKRPPKTVRIDEMPCVHPNAAGIDLGSSEVVAAFPHDRDPQPVRVFSAFTNELQHLVQWLLDCGIDTVAMESTGVYWIPLFEMLEAAGMTVFLVNARHYRAVPGRKSDFNDAQWLQMLHAHGLLRHHSDPMMRWLCCAHCCVTAHRCSNIARRTSCTCKRRSS